MPDVTIARDWVQADGEMKGRFQRSVRGQAFAALAAFVLATTQAFAANCNSNATGNWNTSGTWSCNRVPADGDTVTIQNGHTITLNANTNVLAALTINSGGQLTLSGTSGNDICLGGNVVNNGILDLQSSSGTNTIYLAGSNVTSTLSGTGTWLLDDFDLNGRNATCGSACSGACRVEISGSPNLQFATSSLFAGNSTSYTFNAGNNATATVTLNRAGSQSLAGTGVTYPNLVLAGSGTKTLADGNGQTINVLGSLTINSGVTASETSRDPTVVVAGGVSNAGTYAAGSGTHTFGSFTNTGTYTGGSGAVGLAGNFSNSGTFTSSSGQWTFQGSAAQSITGTPTFQNLRLNNASGLTLAGGDVTVSTVLTLTSGKLATGGSTLIASGNCPGAVSGGGSGSYVSGSLRLTVPSTNPATCTFPIGDASNYSPIVITKTGGNSGTLTGTTSAGDHADTTAYVSGIEATKSVNRTWTLTAGTLSGSTPYSATFQFCGALGSGCNAIDVDSGASTASFIVAEKVGSAWSTPTVGTRTATTTQATGLSAFGTFAVGEAFANVNCTSAQTGNWNDPNSWVHTGNACHGSNGVPLAGDTVTVAAGHTITLNANSPRIAGVAVNSGGTLANTGGYTLTLGANTSGSFATTGFVTNNGTLSLGTGSVTLSTDFQFTGTSSSIWTLNQLGLGGKNLTFGASDSYTIDFVGATPLQNVGSLNASGTNSTVTFRLSGAAQTLSAANVRYPNLVLAGSGAKSVSAGTLDVRGSFTLNSGPTFNAGANSVDLYGNFNNNGDANFNLGGADTGTWTFKGTAIQNINSTGTSTKFPNLTINNANGIALNASATINTLLTLTSGYISTGANILSTAANCPGSVSGGSSASFVAGNLQLTFPSGAGAACTFAVGSGTTYAPMIVTMSSTGGTVTGSTTGNEHAQIASSSIDPTKDVNRYWTLTAGSLTSPNYSATFTYAAGDLDISATTGNFIVGRYAGGSWSLPTTGAKTATTTQATGLTGFGDFAVGEAPSACNPPTDIAGLPAMTCVCDNFGRSSLNPSTIYGQDWIVNNTNQSSSFGNPRIVNSGYLRLTDNSTTVATVANVPSTFPAAGNIIVVEFKHYAYNSTNSSTASPCSAARPCGADGIALTLSDATLSPTPGAFGGSLGYAQKSNPGSDCTTAGGCPGFNGGWLGVGIDEWGNFAAATEGRSGGATGGRTPQSITLRGSGSGQSGYPYLANSGALTPTIDSPTSTSASRGYTYRVVVDARNYTPTAKTATVQIQQDQSTGTFGTPISFPNIYTLNASQAAVPANWKLSFTGSTGAVTNIHEISGLKICAQSITPPAGYLITVDNLAPSTCAVAGGTPSAPIVTVTALDSQGSTLTNYQGTVTLAAKLSGGGGSAGVWSKVTGYTNGTLSASSGGSATYAFQTGDAGVAKFYLTDASSQDVYVTVTESGGSPSTTLATPVQYRGGSFTVADNDTLGSGVIAGRPHRMQITRTNCGTGTDASYTGTKSLDAWYDPVTNDHPTGAAAPQICPLNAGACQPTAGSPCTTLSINAPALSSGSNNVSLAFSAGVADFCLATSDVGKYSVGMRDDSVVASPVLGSTTTLTARPFAIAVSNVLQGTTHNPADNTAGGSATLVAGTPFQATVGGYLWNSAGDANGDGLPDASATLAGVTGAGAAPHYADTVTLWAVSPYQPSGGTLAGLANGSATLLSNGGGVATVDTLRYDEAGSFTLSAIPSANYLNSTPAVNLLGRVAIFANPDSSAQTAVVGRFRPAKLLVAATPTPVLASACASGGFTYLGQEFGFQTNPTLQVTAVAANGQTTRNYGGSYWKLAGTLANRSYADASTKGTVMRTANGGNAALAGDADYDGLGTLTVSGDRLTYTRPAAPTAAFATLVDLSVPAADLTDSDGVCYWGTGTACTGFSIAGIAGGEQRFGRLWLANAYGSDQAALSIRYELQYWNGQAFVRNINDSCTSFAAANVGIGNITATGAAIGGVAAGANGCGNGCGAITVTKPTTAGSADVVVNLGSSGSPTDCLSVGTGTSMSAAYLGGKWCGANYDRNPNARATFGVYGSSQRRGPIYIRENY